MLSGVLTKEKASCFIDPHRHDAMRNVTGDNDLEVKFNLCLWTVVQWSLAV